MSLSSTVNNGVATYPITISADNTDGNAAGQQLRQLSDLSASQNDNCLMLPIQAVRTVGLEDGSTATVVYVQADSRPDNAHGAALSGRGDPRAASIPFRWRSVFRITYNVEIKSGVNEGDTRSLPR